MRRLGFWLALAIVLCTAGGVAIARRHPPPPPPRVPDTVRIKKELRALEDDLNNAAVQGDVATVQRLLADDLISTNDDGIVVHKADELKSFRSGDTSFQSIEISDIVIREYGKVGVVAGQLSQKGRYREKELNGALRFTHVWVRRNGRWQLAASQQTQVRAPQPH